VRLGLFGASVGVVVRVGFGVRVVVGDRVEVRSGSGRIGGGGVERFGGESVEGGIGEAGGIVEHVVPRLVLICERVFLLEIGEGVEHELADIGEDGGVAGWDAVLGRGGEEFAENEVDVRSGHELAGEGGGEFGAEALGFQELHLIAGVEETEGGMGVVTEHAAAASVGSLEMAAIGVGRSFRERSLVVIGGGCFLWHFHWRSLV
jgi:hypothetical protein